MKGFRKPFAWIALVICIGLLLPQSLIIPVEGANRSSYNSKSFWYYPWGKSVTHKGIDIFAKRGTVVHAPISGLIVYKGTLAMGGNVVVIFGPKWRLHYFAHLDTKSPANFGWVTKGEKIGEVGTSGNAQGKSPHLHYSILSLVPFVWRIDKSVQGWKKMFYLNPDNYL